MFNAQQPACDERVRRFNEVQHALAQAIGIARSAAITPTVAVRVGKKDLASRAVEVLETESLGCAIVW